MLTYLIIILVIAILSVVAFFYFQKQKRTKILDSYLTKYQELEELDSNLKKELKRTREISKNNEGINLYVSWTADYDESILKFNEITKLIKELKVHNENKDHAQFLEVASILEGSIFDFGDTFENLFQKVKQYTAFELENTRISLNLKDRIKTTQQMFDTSLKFLDYYTISFDSEIGKAKAFIDEFETLQNNGDYPDGRSILRKCNKLIEELTHKFKIISNFHTYLSAIESDIDTIVKVNDEIENIGFKINVSDFHNRVEEFRERRENILDKIIDFDFSKVIEEEVLSSISRDFTALDTEISEFKNIVEEKFKFISDIIDVMEENRELIITADDIIVGAKEERDEIIKLYEIPNIKQIKDMDVQFEEYANFSRDYEKLIKIILEAKEDYGTLKSRITQANHYIVRLLKNLEDSLKQLKALRQDEIEAYENLDGFKILEVELDLYLRKYDHHDKLSKTINTLMKEYSNKLTALEEELSKEPLDISAVRNLNDALISLGEALSTKELETNIKIRLGCELLLQYLHQYNTNDDVNNVIKRFQNLYNQNEYQVLLKDAFGLLKANTNKADAIYSNIVGKVEVEPFTPVLVHKFKTNEN